MDKKGNDLQVSFDKTFEKFMELQTKTVDKCQRICRNCLIALVAIVLIIVGGLLYFFSAYAVEIEGEIITSTTYEQQSDGESQIINGNSYNDNSIHNDKVKE